MEKQLQNAEEIFTRALEIPVGPARDGFVAARCVGDSELRREVESLLKADARAGNFLITEAESASTRSSPSGTAAMNASAHAEAYLKARGQSGADLEKFISSLQPDIQTEVRQRIEGGLRARGLDSNTRVVAPKTFPEGPPQIPGFQIERKLGEGSLGTVYSAFDEKLNRRVAIKVLRTAGNEQARILNEARKTAGLNHPAIVTVFSVHDEASPPAIVMEMVEGFPLDRFAAQLTFSQKAHLLREIARGLAAAHDNGILHRDLKPDNVIVGPDMRPRILDFGLAVSLDEACGIRNFEGTPLYASPEQVRGQALSPASDIFSFGSLMFKVLTGRNAFSGENVREVLERIATATPPFLRDVAVGVPEDLQAICLACLAWNPSDRPTAAEITVEFGRFLVGEPVRLKPKLYDDLLRRSISEYSNQARAWEDQSIISREEHDALETMHRRLLADEDHWVIDARRITPLQTVLSGATWLAVVATLLTVSMLRDELGSVARWLLPAFFTSALLAAGYAARKLDEPLSAATFLAGAALCIAPGTLSLFAEMGVLATPPENVRQLFESSFTNQQVLAASLTALIVSLLGLRELKMTGFAWTTAALGTAAYFSVLLVLDWLNQEPETKALWCLPLVLMEAAALQFEARGRVRWTLPFHLIALTSLVASLALMAGFGPTLEMIGLNEERWGYLDRERLIAFSFVLNGCLFLALMLVAESSRSLDLRRASKLLEVLGIVHILSALFINAVKHRDDEFVRADVWIYLGAAAFLMVLAPFRSRWRLLVGGLAGCGLGSYLLVDLNIVARKPFIIGLGTFGLAAALGTFAYLRYRASGKRG